MKYCDGRIIVSEIGVTITPVIYSVLALYTSNVILEDSPFLILLGRLVNTDPTSRVSIISMVSLTDDVWMLLPFLYEMLNDRLLTPFS